MTNELDDLLNELPALILTALADGRVDGVNGGWSEFTGLGHADSVGEGWLAVVHPEDAPFVRERWERMQDTTRSAEFELRLRRHDGEFRWFLLRARPHAGTSKTPRGWCALAVDINDRKRIEKQLHADTFQVLCESVPGLVCTMTPNGDVEVFNRELLDFFGKTAEELRAWGISDAVHPDDLPRVIELFTKSLATGNPYDVEHRCRRFDGVYRWFQVRALPVREPEGNITGWFVLLTDIEDRKRAEEVRSELAHMTRVASFGVLTASIAHEVNQPLSGIITNGNTCLRMLSAEPPNIEGARETSRRTIRDANRASDVIARLRALFAKKQTASEPVNLNDAAREVLAVLRTEFQLARVVLRTELEENLPIVVGDRVQLQQVILNLLLNASAAMRRIDERPRDLSLRTALEGDSVRVSVRDTGVGVDPQATERLFEPFYSTKDGGMGLGLSVCRAIVESHQGALWVEPNDGPGATFSFRVPIGQIP